MKDRSSWEAAVKTTSFEAPRRARPTIIGADALADAARVTPFRIGALGGLAGLDDGLARRRAPAAAAPTPDAAAQAAAQAAARAAQVEAARRAALEDAFRAGFEQGRQQGEQAFDAWRDAHAEAVAQRFDAIAERYALQLAGIERAMAEQVIELAVALARQTVRATLAVRPDAIVAVVQEALGALAEEHAAPVVALHPDDLEPVREQLGAVIDKRGGQLVADDTLAPGDCRVRTPGGLVDATVARRWQRALATIGRTEDWIE